MLFVDENGTLEETGKFIPLDPGLDSLNKNPEDVDYVPNDYAPPDR